LLLMMEAGLRHSEVENRVCREIIDMLREDPDHFHRVQGGFGDG